MLAMNLTGKTALVCGASQGIGRAVACELADLGARIVALARREEALAEVVGQLAGQDRGHTYLALDLADGPALKAALTRTLDTTGPIEILIANSGGPKGGPLLAANEEHYLEALRSHIFANASLVNSLLPGMKDRRYGRIIHIISTSVKVPIPGLGLSNTIRGAVASWSKTLSQELAVHGITVNNVLPGYTSTPRLDALLEAAAAKRSLPRARIEEEWKGSVPLGRFGRPEEIAQVVAFLATEAASYVNGVSLAVDGGRTGAL